MRKFRNIIHIYNSALQNTLFKVPKSWLNKLADNFLLVKYFENDIFKV